MKTHFSLTLCFFACSLFAQNLVKNPSFEEYGRCADVGDSEFWNYPGLDLAGVEGWTSASKEGTADWFHPCNKYELVTCPSNTHGVQKARTGEAYAGFYLCELQDGKNYREYVCGTLTEPLIAGKKYTYTYYLSLADTSYWAFNKIGIYFSEEKVRKDDYFSQVLKEKPQVENVEYVLAQEGWQRITGTYTATGGEKYFCIGNFYSDEEMKSSLKDLHTQNFYKHLIYYFLDDVCISLKENACTKLPEDIVKPLLPLTATPYEGLRYVVRARILRKSDKTPLPAEVKMWNLLNPTESYTPQVMADGWYRQAVSDRPKMLTFITAKGYFPLSSKESTNTSPWLINPKYLAPLEVGAVSAFYEDYDYDRDSIAPSGVYSQEEMRHWANYLKGHPEIKVQINSYSRETYGEADKEKAALKESQKRAENIRNTLISFGATPLQIKAKGWGDTKLPSKKTSQNYANEIEVIKIEDAAPALKVTHFISDANTGEELKNATFSVRFQGTEMEEIQEKGIYECIVKCKGYLPSVQKINIQKDTLLQFALLPLEIGNTWTLNEIHFTPNSDELLKSSFEVLMHVHDFMQENPEIHLQVNGHTDNGSGKSSPEYLLDLSARRANKVKAYLVYKGIQDERLSAKGFGDTQPVAPNDSPQNMAKNRRTAFEIVK